MDVLIGGSRAGRMALAMVVVGLLLATGWWGGAAAGAAVRRGVQAASGAGSAGRVFVSPSGHVGGAGTSCATARFAVIQKAIAAAGAGSAVVVCKGTYTLANQHVAEGKPLVRVNRALTLEGRGAVLDVSARSAAATGSVGVLITHSHVTVSGFAVTGAAYDGIRARPTHHSSAPLTDVRVQRNQVRRVDETLIRCNGALMVYCGGGISFFRVTSSMILANRVAGSAAAGIRCDQVVDSTIQANRVVNNSIGVVLSDTSDMAQHLGPAHGNVIVGNLVTDNASGPGIVLSGALTSGAQIAAGTPTTATGTTYPQRGGVYDNQVVDNTATGNGTHKSLGFGTGAGVELTAYSAGSAVYDNVVKGNTVSGNGLAGVLVHTDYPGSLDQPWGGEYLVGNRIVGNQIGENNTAGDHLGTHFYDGDIGMADYTGTLRSTAGIVLFGPPTFAITIRRNHITGDAIGLWHNPAITVTTSGSTFQEVSQHYTVAGPAFLFIACAPGNETPNGWDVGGWLVPNGRPTTYYFEYGSSPNAMTGTTAPTDAGSSVTVVSAEATVPQSDHYIDLFASNSAGTVSTGVWEAAGDYC